MSEAPGARADTPSDAGAMPDWAPLFLAALRKRASVYCAAMGCGVGRMQVYRARDAYPALRAAWDEILEGWTDRIEATTVELAVEGQVEDVIQDGQVVGQRRTRYPRLNEFLLSSRRREVYGKRETVEHTTAEGGGGLQVVLRHRPPEPEPEPARDVHPKEGEEGAS